MPTSRPQPAAAAGSGEHPCVQRLVRRGTPDPRRASRPLGAAAPGWQRPPDRTRAASGAGCPPPRPAARTRPGCRGSPAAAAPPLGSRFRSSSPRGRRPPRSRTAARRSRPRLCPRHCRRSRRRLPGRARQRSQRAPRGRRHGGTRALHPPPERENGARDGTGSDVEAHLHGRRPANEARPCHRSHWLIGQDGRGYGRDLVWGRGPAWSSPAPLHTSRGSTEHSRESCDITPGRSLTPCPSGEAAT